MQSSGRCVFLRDMTAVHNFSKAEIKRLAIQKRQSGEYYDVREKYPADNFRSAIDRFCELAYGFRGCRRVLDIGSGEGLLPALMKMLGHEVFAVDLFDRRQNPVYRQHQIPVQVCNIETDPLPFADDFFDAVSCCQALEHFTHSHLPPVLEMKRVLRPGGLLEIDVPNAVSFRNRSRMLRGKHITWDYKDAYLYQKPIVYKGREYYPHRHNREFTRAELELLLTEAGFRDVEVRFLKSRRYRVGWERWAAIGTALKDTIPSLRKSLMAFGRK